MGSSPSPLLPSDGVTCMYIAYFDCFSGISGDMMLGAFVDLGVDPEVLGRELAKLNLAGYQLGVEPVTRAGMAGIRCKVEITEQGQHNHRCLSHIETMINSSDLTPGVKELSLQVFRRLARAEAKIHATTMDKIHFHEVGAVDSIIDIVGASICLELLNINRVYSSRLNVGSGFVRCQHGMLPVPAPATMELLRGVPVYAQGPACELVTPTGAAFISTVTRGYGPLPEMVVERIGYGAGWRDNQLPNLLRIVLGTPVEPDKGVSKKHAQSASD